MTLDRCTASVQRAVPGARISHMRTATVHTGVYTAMMQTAGSAYTSVQITPLQNVSTEKGGGLYSESYGNTCNMAVAEKVMVVKEAACDVTASHFTIKMPSPAAGAAQLIL